ncbi:MAG TPA: ice-binding family protein [Candidatus Paceibacterota bacterium]|nr:ice-binding family protein [Candidatus Paceibacterota bacterium]
MKKFSKISIIALAIMFMFDLSGKIAFAAGPEAVNLGTAGNFAILAKTGVSTTGTTSITGDVGISPAEASYITGFSLNLPAYGAFSTSAQVTGKIYAPGYADPTPANITTAVSNMETAYIDGMGRTNPTATELGAGNIGGMTITPGIYKWSTGVTIPTDVTLSGSANDVWIFQIAQNLDISSATKVVLSGGAQANNIFWIVGGQTTLGTTSVFNGNILDQTTIVLNTGATLNGRALAQSAVTLDSNIVTMPTYVVPIQAVTPAPANNGTVYNVSVSATTNGVTTVYNFGSATLKNGSRGQAVMELQKFLNQVLKMNLKLDGKLGPKTIAVIKKWQKDHGLAADGLIGAKTKAKMNAEAKNN